MPTWYSLTLALLVLTIGLGRLGLAALPLNGRAVSLSALDAVLAAVGVAGLVFHCGAMFYQSAFDRLPGVRSAISDIQALGTSSRILYVVPAVLLVTGLRRLPAPALVTIVLGLIAVGITMYDGGPLNVHLASIFCTVVVLTMAAATLIRPARRHVAAS